MADPESVRKSSMLESRHPVQKETTEQIVQSKDFCSDWMEPDETRKSKHCTSKHSTRHELGYPVSIGAKVIRYSIRNKVVVTKTQASQENSWTRLSKLGDSKP